MILFVSFTLFRGSSHAEEIVNPYYDRPVWKLWFKDPTPVLVEKGKKIGLPPKDVCLYPIYIKNNSKIFLKYEHNISHRNRYAGIRDDVYSSRDKGHSYIRDSWFDGFGNEVSGIRKSIIHLKGGHIHKIGANFTSQSTTGMGHDIANNALALYRIERFFYFADVLVAGPAHNSFMDRKVKSSVDRYEALSPIFYNSIGSSGSETWALTKMLLAGGYLPKDLKYKLKTNGIYPATLLYIWKASLPYKTPYLNELRHRVAYNSKGDHSDYKGSNRTEWNFFYHNYNESLHMRNMVNMARNMKVAPPIAIMRTIRNKGGEVVYFLKTTILVKQKEFQTIKLTISTEDCYDLQGLPLTFKWKVLYGHKNVQIKKGEKQGYYDITIPYDSGLPRGRTAIALVVNNGYYDSNPAIINIYRDYNKENLRPIFEGLRDVTILPGEKVEFELKGHDPEGRAVKFYQWAGEVGFLKGNKFVWQSPPDCPEKVEKVTIIASDQTSGNSYNSKQVKIEVRSTVAEIKCDHIEGRVPLEVVFSGAGSRDSQGGRLNYFWEFDDGTKSKGKKVKHIFDTPGFYNVKLKVVGPSGSHEVAKLVHVKHNWSKVLDRGWSNLIMDNLWESIPENAPVSLVRFKLLIYDKQKNQSFSLSTTKDFKPPMFVLIRYKRAKDKSKSETGFDILGTVLGHVSGKSGRQECLWNKNMGQKEILCFARSQRFPRQESILKMYVTKDPKNKNKFRYMGILSNEYGEHFFRMDGQDVQPGKLKILSGNARARFEVYDFKVWAPKK